MEVDENSGDNESFALFVQFSYEVKLNIHGILIFSLVFTGLSTVARQMISSR